MTVLPPPPPPHDSVIVPLRYGAPEGPVAVVIGAGHMPYFVFADGRTEPTTPAAPPPPAI